MEEFLQGYELAAFEFGTTFANGGELGFRRSVEWHSWDRPSLQTESATFPASCRELRIAVSGVQHQNFPYPPSGAGCNQAGPRSAPVRFRADSYKPVSAATHRSRCVSLSW